MNDTERQPLSTRPQNEVLLYRHGQPVSVGSFLASAHSLAKALPRKAYIINLNRDRHEFLLAFCASVLAGQCTLMPPNRQEQTLLDLEAAYPDSYRFGDSAEPALNTTPHWECTATETASPTIAKEQLCAIAFTSGSTGKPSANLKTWYTLYASTQANVRRLAHAADGLTSMVATVPAQHLWGFETSVLMPLFANLAISPAQPLYPQDVVTALEQMPAPRVLVSSPLHLQMLVKSKLTLPTVARILSATAPLTQDVAFAIESAFKAPLLDVFGSSETGIIATRSAARNAPWELMAPFTMEVVEHQTRVTADHLPTAMVLADRVELLDKRQFRWLARETDQVKVAGKRASLADLNQRLLAIDGVEDGMIFEPAECTRRLAAVVCAPGMTPAAIRSALARELDPVFLPRPIVFVDKMPRNETGKLPVSAVRALYSSWRQAKPVSSAGNGQEHDE